MLFLRSFFNPVMKFANLEGQNIEVIKSQRRIFLEPNSNSLLKIRHKIVIALLKLLVFCCNKSKIKQHPLDPTQEPF